MSTDQKSPFARHWTLDASVDFLNHGSFGACPDTVQRAQSELRNDLERQPVAFLMREMPVRLDAARIALARFLDTRPESLAFVANATTGVNTVLASVEFAPGDEILITDHVYNACRNAVEYIARRTGVHVVTVTLPYPVEASGDVTRAVLSGVTRRTRLAVIDHVTSPTALILPIEEIVAALKARGVPVLVDGAHAPGMLPLHLDALGADFYTGNCHKWLCAPKGSAFIHVPDAEHTNIAPLTISHGINTRREGRSVFHDAFDWQGTGDPSPWLCIPTAIDTVGAMLPGGWPAVREHNRQLVLTAHDELCNVLGVAPQAPIDMLGSMAAVRVPVTDVAPVAYARACYEALCEQQFEVPVMALPGGSVVVRISAQLYNDASQYERLAIVLCRILDRLMP